MREDPATERRIARKQYYSIGEVCELVNLEPHVLRYWESQVPQLHPSRNRSGNRIYQRKDIELVLLLKHLLYEEKYTIQGARQNLEQRRGGGGTPATDRVLDAAMVELLRAELYGLVELLSVADPG